MSKKHKAITNALELAASECVRCPNCGDKPVLSYDWKKKRWPWRLTHNKAICPGRFCLEAEKGTVEECVTLWNEHSARNLQWKTGKEAAIKAPAKKVSKVDEQPIITRLLCDLIAAESAYQRFASGDGLKKYRTGDWKKTIAFAKKQRRLIVGTFTMRPADLEIVWHSLHMRANYIETGDVNLSRNDVISLMQHKSSRDTHAKKLKVLQPEQEALVKRLRFLAERYASR